MSDTNGVHRNGTTNGFHAARRLPTIDDTFDYYDEKSNHVCQKVYDPTDPTGRRGRWFATKDGGRRPGLQGVNPPLLHLADVLFWDDEYTFLFDHERLARQARERLGVIATVIPDTGHFRDESAACLKGKRVVVVPSDEYSWKVWCPEAAGVLKRVGAVALEGDWTWFDPSLDYTKDEIFAAARVAKPLVANSPAGIQFDLGITGSAAFAAKKHAREWLVEGILARGQPCIVGGPRKALKTSLMVDLVVSLGHGDRFLGEFAPPHRFKVLFLSGESGEATIQETANRVCNAKGIELDELEGQVFWGDRLPKLSDGEQMEALGGFVRENGIDVIIIDPLYLCMLSGNSRLDAANLFDVGPLLANITRVCLDAGATPILVHHLRKNRESPNDPPELEDLAFAGVQEFARQWILIGRRERYEPGTGDHKLWLNVGGSAGHSGTWGIDITEGVLDPEFTGRSWSVSINRASDARAATREQAETAKVEQKALREEIREQAERKTAESHADRIHKAVVASPIPLSKRQIRDKTGIATAKVDRAIHILEEEWKLVELVEVQTNCNGGKRTVHGYRSKAQNQHRETPGNTGYDTGNSQCSDTGKGHWGEGGTPIRSMGPPEDPSVPVSDGKIEQPPPAADENPGVEPTVRPVHQSGGTDDVNF